MNTKLNRLISLLNENFRLFISISLGIFLFILFFQPYPLDKFDFNNKLLFVAGFAIIVLLFLILIRVVYPWSNFLKRQAEDEDVFPSFLNDFILLALTSVAFAFYLKYVGSISISFYIIFKSILICLSVPVILRLSTTNKELKQLNNLLISEKKMLQKNVEKYEEEHLNKPIEIVSENSSENFTFQVNEIAYIKSADNYVEVVFNQEGNFRKKLIRNTLKNVEYQIRECVYFIRCHRTCIVNVHYIEKLQKGYGNHSLVIKGYDEQIPVSRQYLLKIKETL